MNDTIGTYPGRSEAQKLTFGHFDLVKIPENELLIGHRINRILLSENVFSNDAARLDFPKFLQSFLAKKSVLVDDITGVSGKNDGIYLHTAGGEALKIANQDFVDFLAQKVIEHDDIEQLEKKVQNLNWAIESIYNNNSGVLWNGEINDEDIVTTEAFGKDLKGKTLKQLKGLLDTENKKLLAYYDITGDAHKKQQLLKQELQFYVGIGDKYEGGAHYFSLTTAEIQNKAKELLGSMSTGEIFDYIRLLNAQIDRNYKRSKKVDQVNLKLVRAIYLYTFEKLTRENADEKVCIDFVKLITGRGRLKIERGEDYNDKQDFEYTDLEVDELYKESMIANKMLIYLMYRKDVGVIDKMKSGESVKIVDEELKGRSPSQVVSEAKQIFDASVGGKIEGYSEQMLQMLGYMPIMDTDKSYDELEPVNKLHVSSLARFIAKIKENPQILLSNPENIQALSKEIVKDAFDDINEAFSDNFNETWGDWDGQNAKDLGLTGVHAEIFQLYQDINGNEGLFDWKDENVLGTGTAVFAISLAAGILILGPILAGGAAAFTFKAGLIAGAKLGAFSGVASQALSHRGYDTYEEAAVDVSMQLSIDIIISALMTASGLQVLKKMGLELNPDLLLSIKAWFSRAGWIDKTFIMGEVGAVIYASSKAGDYVKQQYTEHYTDTDNQKTGQLK